jgi:hypothetical protein
MELTHVSAATEGHGIIEELLEVVGDLYSVRAEVIKGATCN